MSSFNPQNAVVYGLTAYQFATIFSNKVQLPIGKVSSINNSYSTVLPFEFNQPQPSGNPQAIEYLFPSIEDKGPNTYFKISSSSPYADVTSAWFEPFSSTSAVLITPESQTATANLDKATLVSDQTVVASSGLTFTFIPGSTQSLQLAYSEGTTLSTTVTNGIVSTTTSGTTTTVSTGVKATGKILGAGAEVNASVSEAWSLQKSEAVSYSEAETDTVSTNVTTTVTVNVNTATPTADGKYVYQNSNGQQFYLTPGNQYKTEIVMDSSSYTTPVPNKFNIVGSDMSLPMNISYSLGSPGSPDWLKIKETKNFTVVENVERAIYYANNYGYSGYSGVDPSLFSYQATPIAQAVYSGLINSTSVTGTNATVVILPVATIRHATVIESISDELPSINSIAAPKFNISSDSATAINSIPDELAISKNGTTKLDLQLAAERLSSNFGVYFNNIDTEDTFNTRSVDISGHDHASVKLGNLDYTLTNFSNSIIEVGSGNNKVILTEKDNNNSFVLGSGNNEVVLNGSHNNIHMGGGANWIDVSGGTGENFVIAGDGPTALSFRNGIGFTQVSNWDVTEDAFLFSPDIERSNVQITFDSTHWAYDVYVNNNHVANILTTGGIKLADESSTVFSQIYAAPMPYNLQSNEGFVNGLYVDVFSRVADSAGISHWTAQLDDGLSRKSIIQDFLISAEYNAAHLSNNQHIKGLYEDLLGRHEDASGADYWVGQLDSGVSRATVVGTFLASAEFNNLVGIS